MLDWLISCERLLLLIILKIYHRCCGEWLQHVCDWWKFRTQLCEFDSQSVSITDEVMNNLKGHRQWWLGAVALPIMAVYRPRHLLRKFWWQEKSITLLPCKLDLPSDKIWGVQTRFILSRMSYIIHTEGENSIDSEK